MQELRALDLLASTPMPAPAGDKVQTVVTGIDVQLDKLKSPFAIENRLPSDLRASAVDVPRNATMLDALEAVVKQAPATWYPWGKSIVVVSKTTQIRDQLTLKTFTARFNGADVAQVLEELRRRTDVDFTIEPGALMKIPPESRTVKVFWDNVSAQQALESLKGVTGLDYVVTDTGVTISNPGPGPAAAASIVNADPVTVIITLENGTQLFVRQSQVPADLRPYLKHRTQKEWDTLRTMAQKEHFPLTQPSGPSTAPAAPAEKPRGS